MVFAQKLQVDLWDVDEILHQDVVRQKAVAKMLSAIAPPGQSFYRVPVGNQIIEHVLPAFREGRPRGFRVMVQVGRENVHEMRFSPPT